MGEAALFMGTEEKLADTRIGMRAAGFDVIDADAIETAGDGKPVVDAERNVLALGVHSEGMIQHRNFHKVTS